MTTQQLLNKNVRNMPSWVMEANDRIGPKPPPLPPNGVASNGGSLPKAPALPPKVKTTPEPDYEVIEFSNQQQQYSNEPLKTTVIRTKTPDNKLKCTLCGSQNPWVTCAECAGQIFCASCDDMFHKHPKRKQHMRKAQSMAQLNCTGCQQNQQRGGWPQAHQQHPQHPDEWSQFGSQQHFNHSNLSLNVGPGYMPQQQHPHHPHYPPPVFMTQRGMVPHMYPGAPGGYPMMHPESVENIWNTLDESIQAQAEEVFKQAQNKEPREVMEMGTSPPPQSISTQVTFEGTPFGKGLIPQSYLQTYDALPFVAKKEEPPVPERFRTPEPSTKMERRPYYRSNSQLPQENERYRSANDLRYANNEGGSYGLDPFNTGQVTRRPNFINDLRMLQHQSSSPFDLPHDSFSLNLKHEPARDPETEMHIILKELELYKFTVEELEAALKYCSPDTHPIQWLRENWHKLVQTVQSLSTKYGQERGENTIGSISQNEAREALRSSSGNVWQAVADCIQQRQQKYRKLASKGNFLREDIVNALTAHQGNVEQALLELNRTQLKPFLMRIWGSPNGVENESGAMAAIDTKSDITDLLNTHASDCLQQPQIQTQSQIQIQPFDFEDSHSSPAKSTYATPSPYQLEDSTLKNLEILIGNMEQNQAKQNQDVLRSIESMLETFKGKPELEYETDPEVMRILTKSPISALKPLASTSLVEDKSTEDVKNFVWQHIQDIVPNLVQQVEQELKAEPQAPSNAVPVEEAEEPPPKEQPEPKEEPPLAKEEPPVPKEVPPVAKGESVPKEEPPVAKAEPLPEPETVPEPIVDPGVYIMEEFIRPNIREASIREELATNFIYATEIANFKLEFDRGIERLHEAEWEPEDLEDAEHLVYKSYTALKEEAPPLVEEVPEQAAESQKKLQLRLPLSL
ncbi:GL25962 [Drosophila persimilis]|uniref:GL25962 n=1 Tax=Drosophila persimilis TaxID=7234 RepID=B4GJX1_DROPE|nr:GL25962 [Drosophila persimilis]